MIYGDDYVAPKRTDTSKAKQAIKGFAPAKSPAKKPPIRFP